jgi:predicted  nucleic acid-binding Zn-ribbon protein
LNKHLEELIDLSKLDKSIDDFTPLIETAQRKVARRAEKRDDILKNIEELNEIIEKANSAVISYEEQIKALNEQLIAGEAKSDLVKTEKEMKALSMESELAKEKLTHANAEIERQQIIVEAKAEEIKVAESELELATAEFDKISTEVNAKLASIEGDKAKLFGERETKTMAIDMKILSFYEKIRIWARNTAVVPIKKQACYGCYMKLNESTYASIIKSEEIITCPHCGRIVFLEPQTAESDA